MSIRCYLVYLQDQIILLYGDLLIKHHRKYVDGLNKGKISVFTRDPPLNWVRLWRKVDYLTWGTRARTLRLMVQISSHTLLYRISHKACLSRTYPSRPWNRYYNLSIVDGPRNAAIKGIISRYFKKRQTKPLLRCNPTIVENEMALVG